MIRPALSVVIPTRDRRQVLMTTLRALAVQDRLESPFEVIVVDDGSTDGSLTLLRGAAFEAFDLRVVELHASGPAFARNRGIAIASADRVLLLGDDTVPKPGAVAAHLDTAAGRDIAVQGRIDWDPKLPITEVMDFLAPAGPQFWFRGLVDGGPVPWSQVVGSNLSAPTRWFTTEPFDERFTDASMEDTELAWRWQRRGWNTVWSARATCRHRHHYDTIGPFLTRQRRAGRWARLAVRLHPRIFPKLVGQPAVMAPWRAVRAGARAVVGRGRRQDLWDLQCRWAFLRGFLGL